MVLKKLILHNFKNYVHQIFDFDDKFNIIVGSNGMGKTNVLEAIYFLAFIKSKSLLTQNQLKRDNKYDFTIDSLFISPSEKKRYTVSLIKGKRTLSKNKEEIKKVSEHFGEIPLVSIFPDDINLVYADSSVRRRFMDHHISQYSKSYLILLQRYKRLISQKTALLKNDQFGEKQKLELLRIYDPQIIQLSNEIIPFRKQFVEQLNNTISVEYNKISNQSESETVSIGLKHKYDPAFAKTSYAYYQKQELQLKRTLIGIHRDDLLFKFNGKMLKKYASQGQLKTFIIALQLSTFKLIQKINDRLPILLLDDLFEKLDIHRIEHLLRLISSENFGQVFITTTDDLQLKNLFEQIDVEYKRLEIKSGTIQQSYEEE